MPLNHDNSMLGNMIGKTQAADGDKDGVQAVVANANSLLRRQAALMKCNPACQDKKKLARLLDIYDNKKDNLQTAPMQVDIARKNYLEFKYGADEYVVKASVELRKQADVVVAKMTQEWADEKVQVNELIADYASMVRTNADLTKYYARVTAATKRLDKNFKAKKNDTITNDRKAYYQEQGVTNLRYWFYFLRWMYGAMVVAFLFMAVTAPSAKDGGPTSVLKYGVLAALALYPFVVAGISVASFALIRRILTKLPYNAFTMDLGVYRPSLNAGSTHQYNPGSVEANVISNATAHGTGAGESIAAYFGRQGE